MTKSTVTHRVILLESQKLLRKIQAKESDDKEYLKPSEDSPPQWHCLRL